MVEKTEHGGKDGVMIDRMGCYRKDWIFRREFRNCMDCDGIDRILYKRDIRNSE